jgi:hypothetical protein
MHESENTPGWISGQLSALGVAIGVLIAEQPNRNVLLAEIAAQLDQLVAETKSPGFRAGIASARRMYIPPPVPSDGQPPPNG